MSKCLITKLAEAVNDANLLKLGEVRFQVSSFENFSDTEPFYVAPTDGDSIKLSATSGHFLDSSGGNIGTELSLSKKTGVRMSSGSTLVIDNKYHVKEILVASSAKPGLAVDFKDVKSMFNLSALRLSKEGQCTGFLIDMVNMTNLELFEVGEQMALRGNLNDLSTLMKLQTLNVSGTQIKGSTVSLAQLPLTSLYANDTDIEVLYSALPLSIERVRIYNSKCTDNIANIGKLPNLTYLDASNTQTCGDIGNVILSSTKETITVNVMGTNVSGAAEDFFESQIGVVESGAKIDFYAKGSQVTYNGSSMTTGLRATYTGTSYSVTSI